jgi:hypothetical protein
MIKFAKLWNIKLASPSTRAGPVEKIKDIGGTTEKAVVIGDAPTKPQTAISSFFHQHHLIGSRTAGIKRLKLTIFSTCPSNNFFHRSMMYQVSHDQSNNQIKINEMCRTVVTPLFFSGYSKKLC